MRTCRNNKCDWRGNNETCSAGNIDELGKIHTNYRCPKCYYLTEEVNKVIPYQEDKKLNLFKKFLGMFR